MKPLLHVLFLGDNFCQAKEDFTNGINYSTEKGRIFSSSAVANWTSNASMKQYRLTLNMHHTLSVMSINHIIPHNTKIEEIKSKEN